MALRGRKPQPSALKLVTGAGKRPVNDAEPQAPAFTDCAPPDYLNDIARDEWRRVIRSLIDSKVAGEWDLSALAAYCAAYADFVVLQKNIQQLQAKNEMAAYITRTQSGNYIFNPVFAARNAAAKLMKEFAVEFGMTPSARSRIKVDKPEDAGGWDRYRTSA